MFAAMMISAFLLAMDPAAAKPLTVADVVKGLGLDESKFSYADEPPGKLRELKCPTILRDTTVKVDVRIEIVYTTALFSEKREWNIKAVRAAEVRKVTIEPQVTEK